MLSVKFVAATAFLFAFASLHNVCFGTSIDDDQQQIAQTQTSVPTAKVDAAKPDAAAEKDDDDGALSKQKKYNCPRAPCTEKYGLKKAHPTKMARMIKNDGFHRFKKGDDEYVLANPKGRGFGYVWNEKKRVGYVGTFDRFEKDGLFTKFSIEKNIEKYKKEYYQKGIKRSGQVIGNTGFTSGVNPRAKLQEILIKMQSNNNQCIV